MSLHKELSRSVNEFTKYVRTLDNCSNNIKELLKTIPNIQENVLKQNLEKEVFEKQLTNMKNNELEKKVESLGNVMLSKPFYEKSFRGTQRV